MRAQTSKAVVIGATQVFALLPGIGRDGIVTVTEPPVQYLPRRPGRIGTADKIREQMSTADERDSLTRRGFWLEYASTAWMTVEAAVAITAGIVASSIALLAFGLDSVIEFAAGAIVIWQLRGGSSQREHRAVRLIGVTFFLLLRRREVREVFFA